MHWIRNTDGNKKTVTYKALGGYDYRSGLRKLGFEFDGRLREWRITVSADDRASIEAIEKFLKASDKYDQAAYRWRV